MKETLSSTTFFGEIVKERSVSAKFLTGFLIEYFNFKASKSTLLLGV